MRNIRCAVFLLFIAALAWCETVYAREISFELKLDDSRILVGRQTKLYMILPDEVPVPDMPFIKDLAITYVRDATEKRPAANGIPQSTIHTYRIVGINPGSFTIGPIIFEHGGNTYRSNALVITVITAVLPSEEKSVLPAGEAFDITKHIYLEIEAPKTMLFVNERLPIAVRLYSDWFSYDKVIKGKISGDDLIINELDPEESTMIKRDGVTYSRTGRRAFATAPMSGRFTINPVTTTMDIVNYKKEKSISILGNIALQDTLDIRAKLAELNNNTALYEQFIGTQSRRTIKVKSAPLHITVLPLPTEERPKAFSGAVGTFSMDVEISASEVSLGDEVIITANIKGPGNYSTVSAPYINRIKNIKWREPRRTVTGPDSVTYEQSVRFQSTDVKEIPAAIFTFFDPETKKYVSLTKGPFPIRVIPPPPGAAIREKEVIENKEWIDALKKEAAAAPHSSGEFYRERKFLIFETFPILIVIAGIITFGMIRYLKARPFYIAAFIASRKAERSLAAARAMIDKEDARAFYEFIFRILQDYFGTRQMRPPESVTSAVVDEIDPNGVEQGVIESVREVFYKCNIARYSEEALDKNSMKKVFDSLAYAIDRLNKKAKL